MYILYIMLDKLILKYKGNFKVPIIVNNLMKKRNVIMGLDQQILTIIKPPPQRQPGIGTGTDK